MMTSCGGDVIFQSYWPLLCLLCNNLGLEMTVFSRPGGGGGVISNDVTMYN